MSSRASGPAGGLPGFSPAGFSMPGLPPLNLPPVAPGGTANAPSLSAGKQNTRRSFLLGWAKILSDRKLPSATSRPVTAFLIIAFTASPHCSRSSIRDAFASVAKHSLGAADGRGAHGSSHGARPYRGRRGAGAPRRFERVDTGAGRSSRIHAAARCSRCPGARGPYHSIISGLAGSDATSLGADERGDASTTNTTN